ncbi:M28 family peptidase [bacterium]|nr:MAG: M28 family peptidase [bacterium]
MRPFFGIAAWMLCIAAAVPVWAAEFPLYGFDQAGSSRELSLEQTFLTLPTAQGAAQSIAALTAHSRFDGSWGDAQSARWLAERLRSFGWQTELAAFPATVESPKRLTLELLAPHPVRFELREATAGADAGIPFAYGSPDGDVRAPLVYANYGSVSDFAILAGADVAARGAIVLLRDGADSAAQAVRNAQAAGAVGAILYPDPADDGAGRGATVPAGPWRPEGSTRRLDVAARSPLRIPVLPVTPAVAQRLLQSIAGQPAPASWRGGLPAPYALGRGGSVHLDVVLRRRTAALVNVLATISGTEPGTAVVLGAHRDAWAYGAADDAGGVATLVEAARALGYLYGSGWRPKRSIVIAGLDGAETGAGGAVALALQHQLPARIAAYIACDTCITGARFEAGASAPLAGLLREITAAIPDGGGSTLSARWHGATGQPPRSGDAAVFAFQAGVATASPRFAGPFGVDGSALDDAAWMASFGDPGYARHRELAQIIGMLALRLADAGSLPQRWSAYDPVLEIGLRALSLSVKRNDLPLDLQPLRAAVRDFERSAARADARTAAGSLPDANQLDAAAALIAHGAAEPINVIYGGGNQILPSIAAPLAAGNEGRVEWGLEITAAALHDASNALERPTSSISPLP